MLILPTRRGHLDYVCGGSGPPVAEAGQEAASANSCVLRLVASRCSRTSRRRQDAAKGLFRPSSRVSARRQSVCWRVRRMTPRSSVKPCEFVLFLPQNPLSFSVFSSTSRFRFRVDFHLCFFCLSLLLPFFCSFGWLGVEKGHRARWMIQAHCGNKAGIIICFAIPLKGLCGDVGGGGGGLHLSISSRCSYTG